MKKLALIWYTWLVWSNILDQIKKSNYFDWFEIDLYNSKNIQEIEWKEYDIVINSWISWTKWLANKEPEKDLSSIEKLLNHIKNVKIKKLIQISSIDVYWNNPSWKDEDFDIHSTLDDNFPYWIHRVKVEDFVIENFDDYHIIRLPWLFWDWLKKNSLYDLIHDHELHNLVWNIYIQHYFLWNILKDIQFVVDNDIKIKNITSENISNFELNELFFKKEIWKNREKDFIYDIKTKYKESWYDYDLFDIHSEINEFIKRSKENN